MFLSPIFKSALNLIYNIVIKIGFRNNANYIQISSFISVYSILG